MIAGTRQDRKPEITLIDQVPEGCLVLEAECSAARQSHSGCLTRRDKNSVHGGCMLQESLSSVKQLETLILVSAKESSIATINIIFCQTFFYLGDYQKVLATFGAGRSTSIKVF